MAFREFTVLREDNKTYLVRFKSYRWHARKHLVKPHENWLELVGRRDPTLYLDFVLTAVQECFGTPRYLHAHGFKFFDEKVDPSMVSLKEILQSPGIEWLDTPMVVYFGHDSGL